MILTHSSIQCFKDCRKRYKWRYKEGLVPVGYQSALSLGSCFHRFAETGVPEIALAELESARLELERCDRQRLETDLIIAQSMMAGASARWKDFHEIESEIKFEIDDINSEVKFCGVADGLVEREDGWWLVEYKTSSRIDKGYVQRLALDTQITAYIWALQQVRGININGCLYRVARKPSIRQRKNETAEEYQDRITQDYLDRQDWYFPEWQMERTKEDIITFGHDLRCIAFEMSEEPTYYMNTSKCSDYSGCHYIPLCLGEDGAEDLFEYAEPHEELKEEVEVFG